MEHTGMKHHLTPSQHHAMTVLTSEWRCAYDMKLTMATLYALVRKGLAEQDRHGALGAMYSPRTVIQFRLKKQATSDIQS